MYKNEAESMYYTYFSSIIHKSYLSKVIVNLEHGDSPAFLISTFHL